MKPKPKIESDPVLDALIERLRRDINSHANLLGAKSQASLDVSRETSKEDGPEETE